MKDNTTKIKSRANQLLSKRKVHAVTPNPPTPDRPKNKMIGQKNKRNSGTYNFC